MRKFLLVTGICLIASALSAQDAPQPTVNSPMWGNKKIVTIGGAQINYMHDSTTSGFKEAKFSLMTLAQISPKLFLISELEVETADGITDIGLEQAQLCYALAPNLTLYAGRFLPKFGKYRGILGEGMLNRMSTDPVGYGDGGIGPMVETGIGAVGGLQLGYCRLNYDIFLSNGPQLLIGSIDDPTTAGRFEYESYFDNNKGKAIGGRIGFLPFSNSSLEIGLSGQYSKKTADMNTHLDTLGVGSTFTAIDFNYFQSLDFIKSMIRVMGEYKAASVGKADYLIQGDSTGATYSFDNKSSAYYVQATLRPTKSDNKFLSNLELAVRYSNFTTPKGSYWMGSPDATNAIHQTAVGLSYWLNWDCVLKFTYQNQSNIGSLYQAQLVYRF
jgi:opacity protein-like surface antigen